ncbi:Predicted transcriptional regulator [Trichococcus flocculiformis]|uniref:ArsR/SmtB family transcription factor n=1 Tax=Trichococcus TaxID=82802 RepID=UPI0007A864ED|nr:MULTISPECIES: helix-turn-helix domain-containing protein [Trichococcus]CZR07442.1 helix turn helix arsenical resistance operon repressor [Trichococcus sp. ES5]SHF98543.1 Predicted transcriptional regulator [Trichococcus flocculiformis]
MELDISKNSLAVYEALSSETRLNIIQFLGKEKRNISEIATALGLSNAIITRHVQKMEAANIIKSEKIPGKSGIQKLVFLGIDDIHITFPEKIYYAFNLHATNLKLGHFTNFDVSPTCGLATTTSIVGKPDDPKYFMESDRVNASLLWFSKGFVEYKIPNLLQEKQHAEMLEISFEVSSEFPLSNNVWPSDISIYVNDIKIGVYTVPGNFSDTRGRYTPTWWNSHFSQYGLLKHLRINSLDSGMDGEPFSKITINDLKLDRSPFITLKFAVEQQSQNVGGLTLFGKGFGNHDQDIKVNLYYVDN